MREKTNGFVPAEVLIVDSDEASRAFLSDAIAQMQIYSTQSATTTQEAVAAFEPKKFFLVLLDLHLGPSIEEGIDLAHKLRCVDDDVVIAVVTGHYPIHDSRLLAVIDDLLPKPISLDLLQAKVTIWTTKYRRRQSLKAYIDSRFSSYSHQLAAIRTMEEHTRRKLKLIAELLDCSSSAQGDG